MKTRKLMAIIDYQGYWVSSFVNLTILKKKSVLVGFIENCSISSALQSNNSNLFHSQRAFLQILPPFEHNQPAGLQRDAHHRTGSRSQAARVPAASTGRQSVAPDSWSHRFTKRASAIAATSPESEWTPGGLRAMRNSPGWFVDIAGGRGYRRAIGTTGQDGPSSVSTV